MRIRLSEIPEDGRHFSFNRETGELNEALRDLIDQAPYKVEFEIRPLGNAYQLQGKLITQITETCSLCGWDLHLPLTKDINEILVDEPAADRETHHVHGNQSVNFLNDGPSMTPVQNETFDAAEYVHEVIALAEPLYPSCGDPDCEHLDEARRKREELAAEFARADENTNPFAQLKSELSDDGEPSTAKSKPKKH